MELGYDSFSSELPEDCLELLLQLGKEKGVDPLASIESEDYFCKLCASYSGPAEGRAAFFQTAIERDFKVMKEAPVWIQGSEWPFYRGKPMMFVGQLDTVVHWDGIASTVSFYVFWDWESGKVQTITQCD